MWFKWRKKIIKIENTVVFKSIDNYFCDVQRNDQHTDIFYSKWAIEWKEWKQNWNGI